MSENASNLLGNVVLIAIGVVSGVLGGYIYAQQNKSEMNIMILDMPRMIKPIAEDDTLNDYEKRKMTMQLGEILKKKAARLAEQGVIVFDGALIIKAPDNKYMTDE